jgi:hypothetical protein
MDTTVVGIAFGSAVLLIALVFAVGHYRRERLRKRVIGDFERRRCLYDLSGPKH